MFIKQVDLNNFKVYAGRHEIAFDEPNPRSKRNIYLFGGLNGAGKTSLLQALVAGLYGVESETIAFPRSKSENLHKAYARFLEETLAHAAKQADEWEMSVRVVLDDGGEEVSVERNWWFRHGDGTFEGEESLDIYRNGHPLQVNVTDDSQRFEVYQEYVDSLMPARVAKFFFFDGEEIKNISERDPSDAVVDGLDALLGFSTLSRLEDDLDTIIRQIQSEVEDSPKRSMYLRAQADVDELEEKKRNITQTVTDLEREISGVELDLTRVSERLNTMFSGTGVQKSSDLLDRIAEADGGVRQLAAEIGRFVGDSLYLALPAKLLGETAIQLQGEQAGRQWADRRSQLDPQRDRVKERLFGKDSPAPNPPLTTAQRKFFAERFIAEWVDMFNPPPENVPEIDLFPDWTSDAFEAATQQIIDVGGRTRNELLTRLSRRAELDREADRLRTAHKQFELGPEAQEAIDRKASLSEKKARLEHELEDHRRAITARESDIATARAKVSKLGETLAQSEEVRRRYDKAVAARETVRDFMDALRQRRLKALGDRITEMMRKLTRKEDLVSKVIIDPTTYTLRILNSKGVEVISPSAGEREIFALSMIWGLGKISGRSLPMIIDTPLGRLDQSHRANIVRHFLPAAGDQVLILSTDAEIDERWYEELSPRVVQEFALEHNEEDQTTNVISGRYLKLGSN